MIVTELAPGLWRWTARHPDWTEDDAGDWDSDVGCVYCEVDGGIVTIDPLVPSEQADRDRFWAHPVEEAARLAFAAASALVA